MLDERDFQRIGQLLDQKLSIVKEDIASTFDTRVGLLVETKMTSALQQNNVENNKLIIAAVGEMLEQNVFPQFAEIHREMRQLKIVARWQS